jgi:hypothetical protein
LGTVRSRRKSGGGRHRFEPRRIELDRWLVASAIALGVGSAMAGGSGLAHADTSDTGGSTSSGDHKSHSSGSAQSVGAASPMHGLPSSGDPTRPVPNVEISSGSGTTIAASTAVPTSTRSTHPAGRHLNAAGNTASSLRAVTTSLVNSPTATPSTATQNTTPVSTASRSRAPALATSTRSVEAAATPTKQAATLGIVTTALAQLSAAVDPASMVNSTGRGALSVVPGLLVPAERDLHQTVPHTTLNVHPVQAVVGLINGLLGALSLATLNPAAGNGGQTAVPATAAPTTVVSTTGNATVPLQVVSGTEPVVDISVNGGPTEPVLVDTGSDGLVVGLRDVGLPNLGWPTGLGISNYSGGLTYLYATFTTTVDFENGIVTAPTSVDVVLLSFPESFESFVAGDGAVGILGVGPNAEGPEPSSVIAALPGNLSDGVLIDEPDGVLEFGPNPLPARASVAGSPAASLMVQVNNGPLEPVAAIIDSGGVYGTIPSSVTDDLPAGTVISVYSEDGQTLLYSYTIDGTNTPTVTSDDVFNTGYEAFAQQPVYVSYSPTGVGTTTFDYL